MRTRLVQKSGSSATSSTYPRRCRPLTRSNRAPQTRLMVSKRIVSNDMMDNVDRPKVRPRRRQPVPYATPEQSGADPAEGDPPLPRQQERRRQNPILRRLVDNLLEHVRDLSGHVEELSAEELDDAQQRFNWTAELMWATIVDEKNRPDVDSAGE